MKTFAQFLSEAPFVPKAPSTSETLLGVVGGNLLGSPLTNTINIPQSKASSGSMGFYVDPITANKLNNELTLSGRNPENYNSSYSATTDLRSDENNQQHDNITFRSMLSMFDQLPPEAGNPSLAAEIAQTMSVNGFKVDEIYDFMIKEYQKALNGQQIFMNPYQIVNQIQQQKQTQGQTDITKNINTFDPLADLKKHKLFAPVEYNEVMGDEVGESGFEGTGTDAIYGS